jgi:hypothetical protein
MDLDTFLTTVYVKVDDWYKANWAERLKRKRGRRASLSDSEVLTLALVGQWRVGVPWQSERGLVRFMQQQGRGWFPQMLGRSGFNQRVRNLWAVFIQLQQAIAHWLEPQGSLYECVDCVPLPACSLAQSRRERGHWWWWSRYGHGGTRGGSYFGDQVVMSASPNGVVSGWLVGDAMLDDRWLLQALLRLRARQVALTCPPASASGKYRHLLPPASLPLPAIAAGPALSDHYLADGGFGGERWHRIWRTCGVCVLAPPPNNAPDRWTNRLHTWHRRYRQPIETAFAHLTTVFSFAHLQTHSRWGQLTALAAMFAAYNLGLWLNQLLGRPLHALATLIV